ncbi:hypothetical protein CA13_68060 [Planctomycetes bacterium CA13]|uniref:BioF2-like acetyltransferase domain-containing protein n=1 Tax=Novipirellula herctigrandis TaxID=2527986 RepID=A0A5C5YN48_9BACT|nr:hypothetical protein CA13_68060 [Planctomycetes bacterium CA13]
MPCGTVSCLTGLSELRSCAGDWDDLWSRSVASSPTCRAEVLACWVERFASDGEFRALVVEDQGRLLAALPLVPKRLGPLLIAGDLPVNDWSQCGDLLLDEATDVDAVLRRLANGFEQLPWSLLWLDGARIESSRWSQLERVFQEAGLAVFSEPRFNVGLLETTTTLQDLEKSWSKNFRKDLRRSARRLSEQGQYELNLHTNIAQADVDSLFQRVLEVDQKTWKAQSGTAIEDSEGLAEYYRCQSRLLAEHGELVIALLEVEGQAIAYEFGWLAKSVYHSFKVGFDERFAKFAPGQFTMYLLIEKLLDRNLAETIDCIGPLSEATSRFRPGSYTVGRMLVANQNLRGRAVLASYKNLMPLVRRWRKRLAN